MYWEKKYSTHDQNFCCINMYANIYTYTYIYISICIHIFVVKSCNLCLFAYSIITQEPLEWFASNFDLGTREGHGNCFEIFNWHDILLIGKIAKIVIFDNARVIGGINYDFPGQRWVLKLVYIYKARKIVFKWITL